MALKSFITHSFLSVFRLQSRDVFFTFLILILSGLSGCAHTECEEDGICSPAYHRVKKCFFFHKDKCSPHPYHSLDGYQADLDKIVVKHAAKKCARESLKTISCNCKDKPSKAFRKGYQQAYVDIALGESGEVPPVPPEEYWAAHYRTPEGYLEIQEWFTGYKLGAEHALAGGRYDYDEIATPYSLSGWNQPAEEHWDAGSVYHSQPQTEVHPEPQTAPPASIINPPPRPEPHELKLPKPSVNQPGQPLPMVPQHHLPLPPPPALPGHTPPVKPVLPQPELRKQPPVTAPKPPPVIQAPAVQPDTPATQQPAIPPYINDDPPPSPYTLQSYPYTPLPDTPASAAVQDRRQREQMNDSKLPSYSTADKLPNYRDRR
ncbi:hypothetical protein [Gimesia algae]|uniref:hypothetical protein n=1 Tax=Gimesia algae TaxID=2527971 RepID=UPI00119D79C3|nr:hypothetical protein [Gimesia algae]